ncbi:(2Fe-2S) ferredoxin domain-containing protein [Gynuella sp.]|uniref:(2Fe-2S) ferredoxin domain-containing protein n=1 Tax=Gynuella sp. TaxID=2969146 RepID=UPI003D0F2829
MPKPVHHVFVCIQNRDPGHPRGSCSHASDSNLMELFGNAIAKRGQFGRIALSASSCIGPCHIGPSVLVYPEGILYAEVGADDVDSIVEQHLINGEILEHKQAPAEVWS